MDRFNKFIRKYGEKSTTLKFCWKFVVLLLVYLNLLSFFNKEALPPDGNLFHLFMLFIVAHLCAKLSYLCHLPPLFGMLVSGFVYGNALQIELDKHLTSTIRSIALMVILLRAGLNLDPNVVKKLSFVCFRLAFGPCFVEAITVSICAHYLFSMPFTWALMLGFVLAAVSPAVVVPEMIKIQEAKLGVAKGIPTLIIAAASVDDVLAITGFSVCLSLSFSNISSDNGSNTWEVVKSFLKGPLEACIGVGYGIFVGFILWYLPQQCLVDQNSSKYNLHRFVILLLAGLFALFGSKFYDLGGSGPLAILVLSFVASLRWRPCGYDLFCESVLKTLWYILQHFLFCLIGADVRIKNIQSDVIVYGLLCLVVGLCLRTLTASLVTYGAGLNYKERLFTAIAWLPKATVQAAIGPVALDNAVSDDDIEKGRLVLTIAVLSILITAPLGAIAIDYFSRLMLTRNTSHQDQSETSSNQSSPISEQNQDNQFPL